MFKTINLDPIFKSADIPSVGKGGGWRPQQADSRDFKFSALNSAVVTTPPPTTEISTKSEIRDQGGQGACVGFAIAGAVELIARKTLKWETTYSPQFIYNNARELIGELGMDAGSYIRDGIKVVNKVGAARESDFMYYEIANIQTKRPPEKAFESAKSFRVGEYYAVNNLTELKLAIANGHPVVGGFLCFSNLNSYSTYQNGVVLQPSGQIEGGHAVCFVGYNDQTGLVKFRNSWSKAWGDDGYGYLPYSFWANGYVDDVWAITAESETTAYPRSGDDFDYAGWLAAQ